MSYENDWQVNITQKSKRVNLRELFHINSNDFKKKTVVINNDYLTQKYNNLLESSYMFVNFEDNIHYCNFTESEHNFIIENNKDRVFNLDNFTKIVYNEDIEKAGYNLNKLKLNNWNIITSFRIRNTSTKKILNSFIYSYYDDKKDKTLFVVLTYFERNNVFLVLLSSYLEVIMYVYKIECEMGKNPQFSKLINKYPYEFKSMNLNYIKNYFNNLPKVWVNNN